jgi:hypothetical protein
VEKIIYLVSYPEGQRRADLTSVLTTELGPALAAAGAHGVQINVADDDVAAAAGLRISMSPEQPDAVISVWIDSAIDHLRRPFDDVVTSATSGGSLSAYLVTESVPMANTRFPASPGERTHGMAQIAFLRRPEGLSIDEWLDIWLNSHTHIAMDTQDTFAYVQNVVARVLVPGPTEWHAIVEECFPAGAMTDPHVFYDAVGDDELLARRQREMYESVQRFIDLSMIDTVPTSRYALS